MPNNKKNQIIRIILISVLISLIVAAIAFYVVDIIINDTPITKNLFKALAVVFICAGSMTRIFVKKGRRSLKFYEAQYINEIGAAFSNDPIYKKRLLRAVRLYNENNFNKALKYLSNLKPVCKTREDVHAVGLFIGLIFTDMDFKDDAILIYKQIIDMNAASSTVYGNLGSLYSGMGNYDDAIASLRLAIQNNKKNPAAYHNLANLYFDTFDFENAKAYALKALEINHKFRQSASLLAIIYSVEEDNANAEKYSHIALSSGENPHRLKNAIEHYKSARIKNDTSLSDFDTEDDE